MNLFRGGPFQENRMKIMGTGVRILPMHLKKTHRLAAAVLFACLGFSLPASAGRVEPLPNASWGRLLTEFVSDGRVDYEKIKQHPDLLQQSIREFAGISRQTYGEWDRKRQIAFWINAYNLFTIEAIVDKYPPKGWNLLYPKVSIRQIGGIWEKTVYRTAGQVVSLGQIEHAILSGVFKEPRTHFALVCASLGCPPLSPIPYEGETLEQMLDQQARKYLADLEHGLRWDAERRTLYLSQIFSWFGKDFFYYFTIHKLFQDLPPEKSYSLNFIWEYIPDELKKSLTEGAFRIEYMAYDWSLNDLHAS